MDILNVWLCDGAVMGNIVWIGQSPKAWIGADFHRANYIYILTMVLSVRGLYVLPMTAWVFSETFGFHPHSKVVQASS